MKKARRWIAILLSVLMLFQVTVVAGAESGNLYDLTLDMMGPITLKEGAVGENVMAEGNDYTLTFEIPEGFEYIFYDLGYYDGELWQSLDDNYTFDPETGVLVIDGECVVYDYELVLRAAIPFEDAAAQNPAMTLPFSAEFGSAPKSEITSPAEEIYSYPGAVYKLEMKAGDLVKFTLTPEEDEAYVDADRYLEIYTYDSEAEEYVVASNMQDLFGNYYADFDDADALIYEAPADDTYYIFPQGFAYDKNGDDLRYEDEDPFLFTFAARKDTGKAEAKLMGKNFTATEGTIGKEKVLRGVDYTTTLKVADGYILHFDYIETETMGILDSQYDFTYNAETGELTIPADVHGGGWIKICAVGLLPWEKAMENAVSLETLPQNVNIPFEPDQALQKPDGWEYAGRVLKKEMEEGDALYLKMEPWDESGDEVPYFEIYYSVYLDDGENVTYYDGDWVTDMPYEVGFTARTAGTYYFVPAIWFGDSYDFITDYDYYLADPGASLDVTIEDAVKSSTNLLPDLSIAEKDASGDGWRWDQETRTITLEDGFATDSKLGDALSLPSGADSKLVVEGEASIRSIEDGISADTLEIELKAGAALTIEAADDAIYVDTGKLTVTGTPDADGNAPRLHLIAKNEDIRSYNDVELIDCDTYAYSEGEEAFKIDGGALLVRGGRLIALGGEGAIEANTLKIEDAPFSLESTDDRYSALQVYTYTEENSCSLPADELLLLDWDYLFSGNISGLTFDTNGVSNQLNGDLYLDPNDGSLSYQDEYIRFIGTVQNAGPEKNTVSGVQKSYPQGKAIEFTATAEEIELPVFRNEQYIATEWSIKGTAISGPVNDGKGLAFTEELKPGTYTLRVRFDLFIYDYDYSNPVCPEWIRIGDSEVYKEVSFKVTAGESFKDVKAGAWYEKYVIYAAANDLFDGTGGNNFSPNMTLTRSQAVQVFANLAGVDTSNGNVKTIFPDVKQGMWYTAAVKWAYENGVVAGKGDGTFAPNELITREQICVMLVGYVENYLKAELPQVEDGIMFPDNAEISNWAYERVYLCQMADIINGKGNGNFAPKDSTSRAEAATIFTQFHKILVSN